MKKVNFIALTFIVLSILLILNLVGAVDLSVKTQSCDPNVTLISQDPYPAVPGEYVKLVFKVDGLASSECKNLNFKLLDEYPIKLDPGYNGVYSVSSGSYVNDYGSSILIPFKVRVDENALDGDNEIKLAYSDSNNFSVNSIIKKINLNVKSVDAAFELSIKDYDKTKQILTFEIINIGKNDITALTIDLDKQNNFQTKGSVRTIIGSLNSGDDTSFTFEGVPIDGTINLKISYNDLKNVRRTLDKSVVFNSALFNDRVRDIKPSNVKYYVILLIIVAIIGYWAYSNNQRKKKIAKAQLDALRRK